jgi:hypothetical protein
MGVPVSRGRASPSALVNDLLQGVLQVVQPDGHVRLGAQGEQHLVAADFEAELQLRPVRRGDARDDGAARRAGGR